MSTEHHFDLVVIGSGPGGYIAAIRAAQLGLHTACVEKEPELGGTCLRVGCIPSKALLESSFLFAEASHSFSAHGIETSGLRFDLDKMLARKSKIVKDLTGGVRGLLKKHKITEYSGHGRIDGPGRVIVKAKDGTEQVVTGTNILIATGSEVSTLPGIEMDWDYVGGSTEALSYPTVPEHLVVIGAGVIGLELGSVWKRLGAKVTVLEYLPRILPGVDADIAKRALALFRRQGLEFELGVRVTGARRDGDRCVVEAEGREPIFADRVLVSVGRRPYTQGLGLDTVGITLDTRGRITVDAHLRTSAPNVYAIGDVIAGPMLAHKAEDEGVACAEIIATGYGHVNPDTIPGVVYTEPEIAWVGKTEEELKEAGIPYRAGSFPFAANARAKALGQTDGLVKVLAHAETDRVLGVHMIGPKVGELIGEAVAAMEFGASAEDIARTCHAHPTLSETLKEAALAVDGRELNR